MSHSVVSLVELSYMVLKENFIVGCKLILVQAETTIVSKI
jgi:hypothetical protein